MKINKYKVVEKFNGEDGESLEVRYDNRGDPYSQGISIDLNGWSYFVSVYLEKREAIRLADLINKLYPRD